MPTHKSLKELMFGSNFASVIAEAKKKSSGLVDLYALAGVINTSWGKSSTNDNLDQEEYGNKAFRPMTPYSVKASLQGKFLLLSFLMVVNLPDDRSIFLMQKDNEQESKKVTDDHLKKIKKEYKDITKSTLNLKEIHTSTNVEYISAAGTKRTAYFRRVTRYELT